MTYSRTNSDLMEGLLRYFFMVSAFIALMLALSITAKCQIIKETLPDGSKVIEIEGVEYRAFSASKMREFASTKARADAYYELSKQFDLYRAESLALIKAKDAEWLLKLQQEQNKTSFYKDQLEKEKEYSTKLRKSRPLCSPKILIFRICV